ncbi:penicillin-binding protein [Burkholderia sp. Bp8963]|nr:penicillin-binding protein [Burkholderia sp. Bp8963]
MVIRQKGLSRCFAARPIWEEAVILGCELYSHTYAVLQPQYVECLALDARYP